MNLKNNVRKILFAKMDQNSIDCFYKVYYRIRYPKEMQKSCSYGDLNLDKVFYVIRPRTDGTEGLMSLFVNVLKNLYYAEEKGYIPVVDFENYHTQYEDVVNGGKNAWDFYFTQPTNYKLEEVYQSKNVILSGLETQWYHPDVFENKYDEKNLLKLHTFVEKRIKLCDSVRKKVDLEIKKSKLNPTRTLGLYLRGTDYIKIKPSGHPIQPTVEQATVVVDEYLQNYDIDQIFLVTEDRKIFDYIKKKYEDKCVTVSYDTFISAYDGKEYLSHDQSLNELGQSPYMRGLNYLVKIVILSRCKYFVGGKTMGSWAALIFGGDSFEKRYLFDLGVYGK